MRLLYFADPLCSWCYGFGPELAKLLERHPDTRLDLVMGGLRPFNRQKMAPEFKEMLRGHWRHVAAASGLPFSESVLDRDDFIYDTEPPCRAVVTARDMDASKAHAFMGAVQLAFYRDGRDVTQPAVLAGIAAECGYPPDTFRTNLESDSMREETLTDFATAKSIGVSGFPTLGARRGEQLYLVTSGYVTDDVLEYRLAEIERLVTQRAMGSSPG
jgi:putative protein-disulfide isomerase